VYSITDISSFAEIPRIIALLKKRQKHSENPLPLLLVANKVDLEDKRVVSREEGEELATQYRCPYMETSAKTRVNVPEMIETIIKEVEKRAKPRPRRSRKTCHIV